MKKNTFKLNDQVIHVKSGDEYFILSIPDKVRRLEYCDEPFYKYVSLSDGIIWYRRKSEFEDGRFCII